MFKKKDQKNQRIKDIKEGDVIDFNSIKKNDARFKEYKNVFNDIISDHYGYTSFRAWFVYFIVTAKDNCIFVSTFLGYLVRMRFLQK